MTREDELEEQLFNAMDQAAAQLPLHIRLFAAVYINRIRELVELRRQNTLQRDRHMCELFARVEALEGARR